MYYDSAESCRIVSKAHMKGEYSCGVVSVSNGMSAIRYSSHKPGFQHTLFEVTVVTWEVGSQSLPRPCVLCGVLQYRAGVEKCMCEIWCGFVAKSEEGSGISTHPCCRCGSKFRAGVIGVKTKSSRYAPFRVNGKFKAHDVHWAQIPR